MGQKKHDEQARALDDLQAAIDRTMEGGDEAAHGEELTRARRRLKEAEGRGRRR